MADRANGAPDVHLTVSGVNGAVVDWLTPKLKVSSADSQYPAWLPSATSTSRCTAPFMWARLQTLTTDGTVIDWLRVQAPSCRRRKTRKGSRIRRCLWPYLLWRTGWFLSSLSLSLCFTLSLPLLRWDDNIFPTSAGAPLKRWHFSVCSCPGVFSPRSLVTQEQCASIIRTHKQENRPRRHQMGEERQSAEVSTRGKKAQGEDKKDDRKPNILHGGWEKEEVLKGDWTFLFTYFFLFCRANWLTTAVALVTLAEVH